MSEVDLAGLAPDKVVDARGVACPGPLLEAKKGITAVTIGEVIEIWSSDSQTKTDVGAWAGKVGHEFLGSLPADGYDRVFIRRAK
jgi:tRNA 2-thiouridine synthesizing protein A